MSRGLNTMVDELKVYTYLKSMYKILEIQEKTLENEAENDLKKKEEEAAKAEKAKMKKYEGSAEESKTLVAAVNREQTSMEQVAGVILESEANRLRRLVFRITRGKGAVFLDDAFEQNGQMKVVFVVLFNANPPQQKARV